MSTTREDNDTSWEAWVREFQPGSTVGTQEEWLQIPQPDLCIEMPGCSEPFGRPIDANMAVRFIYNFWSNFKLIYDPGEFESFNSFINSLPPEKVKDIALAGAAFAGQVMDLNYAMTLDRNMVLKILSQPKCEGLRFYLCARPGEDGSDDPTKYDISLVTVGVDCEGYDLRYNNDGFVTYSSNSEDADKAVIPAQNGTQPIANIQMQSMSGEYVTPPYTVSNLIFSNDDPQPDEHFVLFNIATGHYTPQPAPPQS